MTSTKRARGLRRNPTDAEKKFWAALRRRALDGHRFRRQHPIGSYFVDFVCLERKLVIELDGGQHAVQEEYDRTRTARIEADGFTVLRFWNNDVLGNIDGCLETIRRALRAG